MVGMIHIGIFKPVFQLKILFGCKIGLASKVHTV